MRLALLLPFETLVLVVSAARLDFPPVATHTVEDGANAALLRPSPTPTARFAAADLLGRDYTMGHDTCGFGSAQSWITYECYLEEATCMNIGEYRGCCTSGSSSCSSTIWTTCEDYQSIKVCGSEDHTRCCQSAVPYCVTWQLQDTDGTTYTAFDCDLDNTSRVREMLATPLESITSTGSASAASASASASSSSSSSSLGSSSGVVSSSTASTTPSGSSNSTSDSSSNSTSSESASTDSSNGSAAPAGAIAGGVVGGLVVIGLTILGFVFFRKRSRGAAADREKLSASPPPPPSGPQEIASSDTTSPLSAAPYGPDDDYANVNNGSGRQEREALHFDPKTGGYVFEAPDTSVVPEVPYAPARGQEGNRAELT